MVAYTYDVNASLPVLLDDGVRKYVWGLGLAYAVDSSGSPLLYYQDGLGSVRALTDSSGSVVQTYLYDEYGVVTSSSGTITQPFGYTGEQRDAETGLVYLRARYYDPASGRFMGRDGVAGIWGLPETQNRYAYALNNPILLTDPSGYAVPIPKNRLLGGTVDPSDLMLLNPLGFGGMVVKGGVYRLIDSAGVTKYVGRSANLAARRAAHRLDQLKRSLRFEVIQQTEDRATQRGLEQLYYDQFMPALNKIRPISLRNDQIEEYLKAAKDFLSSLGGQ